MNSFPPASSMTDLKMAVEHLHRGREFAVRLSSVLREPLKGNASVSAADLAEKVLGSFTETLSILSSSDSDENSQVPTGVLLPSSRCSSDGRKFEDSGESCENTAPKDRRGCYKRRKTSETQTTESPTMVVEDGHTWRKYGQKVILNAKYPRSYFRCTHKYEGCKATKQVQRIQEDPTIYRTIYHGHHTCRNTLAATKIVLGSSTDHGDSSKQLNFESDDPKDNLNDLIFAGFSSIKQEYNQPSSSDYFLFPDLTAFETSGPMAAALSSAGSDHGDVISTGMYSCPASPHSNLEIDMVMDPMNFEDSLDYEF